MARNGAIKARTAAANQLHSLCDTAPDAIRSQLRGLPLRKKVAVAERWRPGTSLTVDAASKRALTTVARRWRSLDLEAGQLDGHIKAVLDAVAAPSWPPPPGRRLLAVYGVGYETAGQLLVPAGDNPVRLGPSPPAVGVASKRALPSGFRVRRKRSAYGTFVARHPVTGGTASR